MRRLCLPPRTWAALPLLALSAACATSRPLPAPPPPFPAEVPAIVEPPFGRAATANAARLQTLPVSPFGRAEVGWEIYMPLIAAEIGADPVPQGLEFAEALARWQKAHALPADGVMSAAVLERMRNELQGRRPFLKLRGRGGPCPDPPDEAGLGWTRPAESWGGRLNAARPGALAAWRRMRAQAARDGALEKPAALQVFSAFRSPAYDAQRCAEQGNCDGVRRATCSAHRTGLAFDLVLDGVRPVDSTADDVRLRLTRSPAYRWLLLNARRYGFMNYPFEPWHWEWTGEPIVLAPTVPSPAGSAPG